MTLQFDAERVLANARQADTEDLLDRATVYRAGMEDEALGIIEDELRRRGIAPDEVSAHAARRAGETFPLPDGTVKSCSFCHRPAVARGWGWHHLWGLFPAFPRYFHYCDRHRPAPVEVTSGAGPRPPG